MVIESYNDNVFINCPFDEEYKPIFNAIVFTIYDCGFVARCSQEEDATGEARSTSIVDIIAECRYGIHDISRTELDEQGLPRFNMPLELGIFLGARRFGDKDHRIKKFLILDRERYRYQQFMSDLAGYDIRSHKNDAKEASATVRDWLVVASRRKLIPDKGVIWGHYVKFQGRLPHYCSDHSLQPGNLLFLEYSYAVTDILKEMERG
jgi:hypothetical protein